MLDTVILAGGRSGRMKGKYKAFFPLLDKPLIKWLIDTLNPVSNNVIVVVHDFKQKRKMLEYFKNSKIKIVEDKIREIQAPIIGALSGAEAANEEFLFLVSCDQPFVTSKIVLEMKKACQKFDACIPRWPNGYLEPLTAIYKREKYVDAVREALRNNEMRSIAPLKYLKCFFIDVYKLSENPYIIFYNINTLEDYRKAREIALKFRTRTC